MNKKTNLHLNKIQLCKEFKLVLFKYLYKIILKFVDFKLSTVEIITIYIYLLTSQKTIHKVKQLQIYYKASN